MREFYNYHDEFLIKSTFTGEGDETKREVEVFDREKGEFVDPNLYHEEIALSVKNPPLTKEEYEARIIKKEG